MTTMSYASAFGGGRWRRGCVTAAFGLMTALWVIAAGAAEQAARPAADASVAIARMILGIVGYARWPVGVDSHRVCLASDRLEMRAVGDQLLALGVRAVSVQWLGSDSGQWAANCDVAYLDNMPDGRRKTVLGQTLGRPILTISGGDPLCASGSLFCLELAGDEIVLQANLDSIARSGIRINPRVLQLAQRKGGRQ